MTIGIIVASDLCRVIGINNTLPWKNKADMRRFKSVTMGSSLIMGRTTWESIGHALPGRKVYVLTHRPLDLQEGVFACGSLEEALRLTRDDETVWVAGGESVYRQALPYVTLVDHTVFPETVPLPLDHSTPVAHFPDLPLGFVLRDEVPNSEDPSLIIKTYYRKPSLARFKAVLPSP